MAAGRVCYQSLCLLPSELGSSGGGSTQGFYVSLRAARRHSSAHRVQAAVRVDLGRQDLAGVAALPFDGFSARRGFKHVMVQEVTRGWVNLVRSRGRGLAPMRPAVVRFILRTGSLNLRFLGR